MGAPDLPRQLRLYGNPDLLKICKPVTVFDDALQYVAHDMQQHLKKSYDGDEAYKDFHGYALAAPQVGVFQSFFVVAPQYVPQWPDVVVNPVMIDPQGSTMFPESCLSIPGLTANNRRYTSFILQYQDEFGTTRQVHATELFAIVCQHEMDHLIGKLFVEGLNSIERRKADKYINKHFRKKK